uniref:KH domain-containing protein n=1 Tax=Panagrellus redivivus TaxID=6233 RepID=A0A7E4UZ77_PANRE
MTQHASATSPEGYHLGGQASDQQQRLTTEQVLQLMSQVASAVKSNDFSATLASNIYLLCSQLKNHGQQLEQNHKSELNKCFVALRQACCRDSGQLGTPCRLKMMELVELRAMGWRPNLAHTQYYLNRPEQQASTGATVVSSAQSPPSRLGNSPSSSTHSNHNSVPSVPIGANPLYPNTMYSQFAVPPPQVQPPQPPQSLFMSQADVNQGPPPGNVPPGYFFIPAGNPNGWNNQFGPHGMNGHHPHHIDPATAAQWAATRNAAAAAAAAAALMGGNGMNGGKNSALGLKSPRLIGNLAGLNLGGSVNASALNPKSNKAAQFREEVTIRNCDSGKIMGVKGRRVAVVEELSKTVISFQKVDPKSKDRVLTITGSTEESILFAKKLIEDTIRRNVSPNREDPGQSTPASGSAPIQRLGAPADEAEAPADGTPANDEDDEEGDDDAAGISIETAQDGTLKLCCDDPDVLQAAQAALTEYLNRARRSTRMSAAERAEKAERRKSMPLPPSATQKEAPPPVPVRFSEQTRAFTGSTPNLVAAEGAGIPLPTVAPTLSQPPKRMPPVAPDQQYSRDQILECRDNGSTSVLETADQTVLAELVVNAAPTPTSESAPAAEPSSQ